VSGRDESIDTLGVDQLLAVLKALKYVRGHSPTTRPNFALSSSSLNCMGSIRGEVSGEAVIPSTIGLS
jgi:hypothetical protein